MVFLYFDRIIKEKKAIQKVRVLNWKKKLFNFQRAKDQKNSQTSKVYNKSTNSAIASSGKTVEENNNNKWF